LGALLGAERSFLGDAHQRIEGALSWTLEQPDCEGESKIGALFAPAVLKRASQAWH
jgi:hypothetical protein